MKSTQLAAPMVAALLAACTPNGPDMARDGCFGGVPECAHTTRGIDGFAANPAYCPPWVCDLVDPAASPLVARIRVGESVKLQIYYSAGLTGCSERSWKSVTWISTDPAVATVVAGSTSTFPDVGVVNSAGVLTGVAPGTVQISAMLHFDNQGSCYPARDERVQLIVSADPSCLSTSVCKTIDAVMVAPD